MNSTYLDSSFSLDVMVSSRAVRRFICDQWPNNEVAADGMSTVDLVSNLTYQH